MPIQPAALLGHDFEAIRQTYEPRDAILYALGLGMGGDPVDPFDLGFLDETGLAVLSTYAVAMGSPGMWIRAPEFGVDFGKLIHSEQMAWFAYELPAEGEIVARAKVASLTDRGEGRGAVLVLERQVEDAATGVPFCRLHQTLLLRGDGGFGGDPTPPAESNIPDRPPDRVATVKTSPRAALIYRLSGDWNPLHIDPVTAQAAGFDRPVLHGLASYGIAGLTVSRVQNRDPARLAMLGCRFSGIVVPGDEMRFAIWQLANGTCAFRAFVGERKVLDNGLIGWRDEA